MQKRLTDPVPWAPPVSDHVETVWATFKGAQRGIGSNQLAVLGSAWGPTEDQTPFSGLRCLSEFSAPGLRAAVVCLG